MNFWGKRKGWFVLAGILVLGWGRGEVCYAASAEQTRTEQEETEKEILGDLELEEVERSVEKLLEEEISFREMMEKLMQGGQALHASDWKKLLGTLLQETMGIQRTACIHILLLVLLSSVCSNLSGVFQSRQISEISFYMIYLLLVVLLLKIFDTFSIQIQTALAGIAEFMRALLPAYYLAMTAATGSSTATIFYQMIIFIIYLADHIMLKVLLPGIRIYLLMELINYLTKEEFLSKMTELLKNGILWSLKTMVGMILGIQLIQRLISPAVDALKRTALGRTAGAIPGVGNIFSGITEMVLGSAVLIKNCLGAAAVVVMLLAALGPVVRLGISAVFYQLAAALVQPVTDKRMVGCIHTMGESVGMLVKLILTVEILFLLTVAILAGSLG